MQKSLSEACDLKNRNPLYQSQIMGPFTRAKNLSADEVGVVRDYFSNSDEGVMIDVGSHYGTSALNFLKMNWDVFAFEPDQHNREKLNERTAQYGDAIKVFNLAVTDQSGQKLPFYASPESSGISSLLPFRETHEECATVATISLSDFMTEEKMKRVDFLKIDCEGCDILVLKGFPWHKLKPQVIICEFEDNKSGLENNTYIDLGNYLVQNGYSVYVSEWHPIVRYGINHQWKSLFKYPGPLSDKNAWGNLLAFRQDPGEAALKKFFRANLKAVSTHKKPPTVSVVLCNYNYDQFIVEAIESVLNQTYQDFELIIVDDGSTDQSRQIISYYQKDHPEKVKAIFQENGGQAAAFNTGYKNATGEIISFLDSDDLWAPRKLEVTVDNYMNAGSQCSLIQHCHNIIDEESQLTGEIHPPVIKSGDILNEYFTTNHTGYFSTTSGLSTKREYLDKIFPLDDSWTICADVLISRALPVFGHVLSLNELLGFYRIHKNNTWMGSENQRNMYVQNQIKYNEYTNNKLSELGINKKLKFKKSALYKNYRLQNEKNPLLQPFYKLDLKWTYIKIRFLRYLHQIKFQQKKQLAVLRKKLNGIEYHVALSALFFFYGLTSLPGHLIFAYLSLVPIFLGWRKKALTVIHNLSTNTSTPELQKRNPKADVRKYYSFLYLPGFSSHEDLCDQFFRILWYFNPIHAIVDRIFIPIHSSLSLKFKLSDHFDPKIENLKNKFTDKIIFFDADDFDQWQFIASKSDVVMRWKKSESYQTANIQKHMNKRLPNRPCYKIDHRAEQYAASHYLMLSRDLNPNKDKDLADSQRKFELLTDRLKQYEKSYIFGTGPSLDHAKNYDFSDGLTIACNSMIKNTKLLEHINPSLFAVADPVFHAGCSKYAGKFRQSLCEAIDKFNFDVIVPFRDYKLYLDNLPDGYKDRIIGIPLEHLDAINLDLNKFFAVKSSINILTIFLIPLACSFANQISILGCDGRKIEDDTYFWNHHQDSQFNDEMQAAKIVHPSFFSEVDYNGYYLTHCDYLEDCLRAGESIGKQFYNLTPSHIPALANRYIQTDVELN